MTPHPLPPPDAGDPASGAELLRTLLEGRWILAAFAALALAVAGAWLVVATPRWRAEALLRLEDKRDPPPLADPVVTGLEPPSPKAEIEVLRARSLVAGAVAALGLDVEAAPRRVPFLGKAAALLHRGPGLAPPRLGLRSYAWGGERIAVSRLEVPEALLDQPLFLVVEDDGGFRLTDRDGTTLVDGAVGRLAEGTDPAGAPVRILVGALVARPGTEFVVTKRRFDEVVAGLQLDLAVEERGKDTGVVALRLEGADRVRVVGALRAMLDAYLRENAARTAAHAARVLAVLDQRLPALEDAARKADKAYERWKLDSKIVDVGAEAKAQLDRAVDLERRIADLEAKRTELARHYTDVHPTLGELGDQADALRVQLGLVQARLAGLPAVELQAARLLRDQQAATAMLLQMQEKAQQWRIAASGAAPSATVIDAPSAAVRPVSPKGGPIALLALLAGLGIGAAVVVIRGRLGGPGNPILLETATGLPVLGTVPHTSTESSLVRSLMRHLTGERAAALCAVHPGDSAVEDLRTLRTNLGAALRAARNPVVAIGGPAPGVGKSFVCVNLAILLASPRRKVLLVDADLRRGRLHREFGLERTPGVAEVVQSGTALDQAIRPTGTEGLDLLAAGELPDDPTAVLESPRFQELLAEAGKRYDVVVVDTPAILAVTDPALVARHAGLNLLVLRAGEHPVEEISLAVKRLSQNGAQVGGAILNDVRPGRHGRYRRYEYRRAKAS
jgi:tyrosine-protein kinase Etk/Wzc